MNGLNWVSGLDGTLYLIVFVIFSLLALGSCAIKDLFR